MPGLQQESQKKPLSSLEPTFEQTNRLQAQLMERFVEQGGKEEEWVKKNAARFRDLVNNDETIKVLLVTDSGMALNVIEEALENDEEI